MTSELAQISTLEDLDEQLRALRAAADARARAANIAHAAAMVSPLWARQDVEMALRKQEAYGQRMGGVGSRCTPNPILRSPIPSQTHCAPPHPASLHPITPYPILSQIALLPIR